ncbi:tol-pal system protein YbgF [uncultured Rhodoblastus sp.]|uniref:tol-pal system protein YbgF n=1 Tax=uncultured Rhodoblastus sp. TaxID=543037 RepID=UPI0025D05DCF|nr:tol-pal system protein YbgF [uncultured Rhodoblastus sp.]
MVDRKPGRVLSADFPKRFFVAAACSALVAIGSPAGAQNFNRPPADVGEAGYGAPGGDTSSILRIDRLENQVRGLNGQVEQLQFQLRRMDEQMRKLQLDVEARFQDAAGRVARPAAAPQKRGELSEGDGAGVAPPAQAAAPATPGADGRRHDAFDPSSQPAAPGAPLPLGSPASGSRGVAKAPDFRRDPGAPLDLTPPGLRDSASPAASPAAAPAASASVGSVETGAPVAAAPVDAVKVEYDAAADLLKSQRYDAAQQGFSAFVHKNPHSRLIAQAIYHLGESYYYQSRHREAAEQFLKIATDYSRSPVAPDAMVKLGVSLNALGAKEQACAFFSEVPRKYPNAPAAEKTAAAREAKKASC